jgi:flagellar biogenesis protein FliO
MQFLTSLFGGSGNTILTAAFALAIVIILIVLGIWLLKILFKASGSVGRGRNRRLSVVDSLAIDPKRQLLIVRRDDVEHLILTGGAQDLVIETGIPAPVQPVRLPMRRPVPTAPQRVAAQAKAAPPEARRIQADLAPSAPPVSIDKLAELAQPAGKRKSASLRHTGLMRPVSRVEPPVIPANTDNSEQSAPDSVRKAGLSATDIDRGGDDDRQVAGGDDNFNENTRKADGN